MNATINPSACSFSTTAIASTDLPLPSSPAIKIAPSARSDAVVRFNSACL
ncbi:hypothetical protein [Nostoc sp. KVJ3]|nr:hypothetical protein [Nostoc sp. KVJ3]